MTTETKPELITVDPRDVTFIIHRDRDEKEFRQVKESIRQMGIRVPLRVREIRSAERGMRNAKWQAFYGEGRCRAAIELYKETGDKSFLHVPALLDTKASESEIAVAFLTENISRSDLSVWEQAALIKADADVIQSKHGGELTKAGVKALAKAYFASEQHILKLLRILRKLSPDLEKELRGMTVGEAEALTTLPAKAQEIVFETLREEGLGKSDVAAVVKRAKRIEEEGAPLSKKALRDELRRVREDLERQRKTAKPLRLHYALGVESLKALLAMPRFRKAMDREGINYKRFEDAVNQS